MVTLTATDSRGAVGTATVVITAGPVPNPPPPVPDGGLVPGTPMQAAKSGSDLAITWDVSVCGGAPVYNVYAGAIGNFVLVTQAVCGLPNTGAATISLAGDNLWWVITGANGTSVGSFATIQVERESSPAGDRCVRFRVKICRGFVRNRPSCGRAATSACRLGSVT